jgi:hypothetical protein
MTYSNFTLQEVLKKFSLKLEEGHALFPDIQPRAASALLTAWLEQKIPLALALSTEKARSEFIIAPILAEVREQLGKRFSLFSGIDFTVDTSQGLNGECDFLFSKSPEQLVLLAPVVSVVEAIPPEGAFWDQEAKNESFRNGLAQACAEMIAARVFNEREGHPLERVYGAVTTGDDWQFLMLEENTLFVDKKRFDLEELPRILGIFCHMLETA